MILKETLKSVLPAKLVRFIRQRRLKRHIAQFPQRTIERVYHGFPLRVHLGDSLAAGWYDKAWPELHELLMLQQGGLRAGHGRPQPKHFRAS
jgi:hypothetical protein